MSTYSLLKRGTLLSLGILGLTMCLGAVPAHALTEAQQDQAIANLQAAVSKLQSTVSTQQTTITALNAKLQYVTASGHDLTITGNLHVVSGSGSTYAAPNGLGNVIIGYNELQTGTGAINKRSGSHCLVMGSQNNYTSYGGIVAGLANTIGGAYADITGGASNTAVGLESSITGGYKNSATSSYTAVGGGTNYVANAAYVFLPANASTATLQNFQTQITSLGNTVSGIENAVANQGKVTGLFSFSSDPHRVDGKTDTEVTMTGINLHIVNGLGATNGEPNNPTDSNNPIVNGLGNLIIGYNGARAGGNDIDVHLGSHNLILGDRQNYLSYGGIAAGFDSTISAPYASVSGGYGNTASGLTSSVSGGLSNTASGDTSSVVGGYGNSATYGSSSVCGGLGNTASGYYSSVSGGYMNSVSGGSATISGGQALTLDSNFGWAGGSYDTE